MKEIKQILCKLTIPGQYYNELSEEVKELFIENDGYYSAEFPAETEREEFLGEYIQAFCEVVLIIKNPKYQITEDCEIETKLLKLGQSEESFSLLVNISYPGVNKSYHDILVFQETAQSLGYYSFELLGDQTMFSID